MASTVVSKERAAQFEEEGYWIERKLFGAEEMKEVLQAFMELHDQGGLKGFYEIPKGEVNDGIHHTFKKDDPLTRFPRVMHPQRFMPLAKKYLLDPRVMDILEELLKEPVLAAQSMFYFKPPGARGQAWHQDNFYLQVKPGSCVAAWIAVDTSDEENGGLQVVPKTHRMAVV